MGKIKVGALYRVVGLDAIKPESIHCDGVNVVVTGGYILKAEKYNADADSATFKSIATGRLYKHWTAFYFLEEIKSEDTP